MMKSSADNGRKVYIDILRIIAVFLVIFTHTGDFGSKLYVMDEYIEKKPELYLYILADVFRCINIPLFLMISGTVMLHKRYSYRQVLKKSLRYAGITIIVSYIYYLWRGFSPIDIVQFLRLLWSDEVFGLMWFMYAYIGLLLMTPAMQKMIAEFERIDYVYFLVLGIIIKSLLPLLSFIFGWNGFGVYSDLLTDMIFYPIVGAFLGHIDICEIQMKHMLMISVACILSLVINVAMVRIDYLICGEYSEKYLFCMSTISSMAIFMIVRKICSQIVFSNVLKRILSECGNCVFGTYLISMLVQNNVFGIYWRAYKVVKGPLIAGYIYTLVVLAICIIIIFLVRKIPIIGKLL